MDTNLGSVIGQILGRYVRKDTVSAIVTDTVSLLHVDTQIHKGIHSDLVRVIAEDVKQLKL